MGAWALRNKWNYCRVLGNLELLQRGVKVILGFPRGTSGWWDEISLEGPQAVLGVHKPNPAQPRTPWVAPTLNINGEKITLIKSKQN